ncbi:isoprenylcysteine carboxylmethyltransferase family protein [Zooshikella sp. WH53]|uniref:Isoprenylcysteine carboxylmethyltransferase family protein n=2 Tax=Zooshikella harenae TaxID=2827238 RepID=A0ABS5ZGR7_9GAMM|nr:isoprenylcysteine carboxylmethyltransferase family protein [Zooshikella harenae]
MWLVSLLTTPMLFLAGIRMLLVGLCLILGVAVATAGVLIFKNVQTTVNPLRPQNTTCLVKTGVYQFTRNPMYLGLFFMLLGWGCYLANGYALVMSLVFVLYMNHFQIVPEERCLSALFGDEYEAYKQSVRRWL